MPSVLDQVRPWIAEWEKRGAYRGEPGVVNVGAIGGGFPNKAASGWGQMIAGVGETPTPPLCDPNSQGDLDGNGQVEFADFLVLAENFGSDTSDQTVGDIDCNGKVEFADFLILAENFGTDVGNASSVPEPSGLALFAAAGLLGGFVRRRHR